MAAVPSIGRADRGTPREAELTRALYERYAAQIYCYCLHQLGSREEAEDAVQSTFLNAFRGIKRGIVLEREAAWLFKIAENVCLSRRRSSWRRERIESPADFELVEERASAPSRLADELVGLQDVLEYMPETQRRAILLREWQGLTYREIADELGITQTAVETLIFRARRSLAKGLEAPPQPAGKRRMVRGADLGNLLTGLKSLLLGSGAAAAKVAAVVAVVGAGTTVVASSPVPHRHAVVPPAAPIVVHRATVVPTVHVAVPAPVEHAAPEPTPAAHRPAPPPVATVPPPAVAADPAPPEPAAPVQTTPAPTLVESPPTLTSPPASPAPAISNATIAPDATTTVPTTTVATTETTTTTTTAAIAPPPDDQGQGHGGNGNGKGSGNDNGHGGGDHDGGPSPHGHGH